MSVHYVTYRHIVEQVSPPKENLELYEQLMLIIS